jgi:hypothetical protein
MRATVRNTVAQIPIDANVGVKAIMNEPNAINVIAVNIAGRRPFRSAIRPKIQPPSGRTRKPPRRPSSSSAAGWSRRRS